MMHGQNHIKCVLFMSEQVRSSEYVTCELIFGMPCNYGTVCSK